MAKSMSLLDAGMSETLATETQADKNTAENRITANLNIVFSLCILMIIVFLFPLRSLLLDH
ncbi:hypothetical protein GCM10023116_20600 [Kistimonas scapharcae]|uniref:Uncharacterized protein n=1 Tax=Kistimonas scapharcae TaxID=1036133 RepID=A0ABP8V1A0_9GAMM